MPGTGNKQGHKPFYGVPLFDNGMKEGDCQPRGVSFLLLHLLGSSPTNSIADNCYNSQESSLKGKKRVPIDIFLCNHLRAVMSFRQLLKKPSFALLTAFCCILFVCAAPIRNRYDVRNLLDDQRLYTGPREIHDNHFLNDSDELDEERFEDLDSDEELLFDMDEDERKDYLGKAARRNTAGLSSYYLARY